MASTCTRIKVKSGLCRGDWCRRRQPSPTWPTTSMTSSQEWSPMMESILNWLRKILFVVPSESFFKIPTYSLVWLRKTSLTVVLMQHGKKSCGTLRIANVDSFVRHLDQGCETVLTDDGAGLSNGQRQLIAIARAAPANAPVLILDETDVFYWLTDREDGARRDGPLDGRPDGLCHCPPSIDNCQFRCDHGDGPRTYHRTRQPCFPWWQNVAPITASTPVDLKLINNKKLERWLQAFAILK